MTKSATPAGGLSSLDDLVQAGRAALRSGDAAAARAAFEKAVEFEASGEVIEGLARVAYLEFDVALSIQEWERAYAAYRRSGEHVGAVRVARTLAGQYGAVVGDWAVGSGWLARAQTLIGDADSSERGWVSLNLGMFEADRATKDQRFRHALEMARETGDVDLEAVALAYLGASLVHGDRPEEGMVMLDEALAAVAGGEVDDFSVLEEIFCQLFSACEQAHDVRRADQWIRVGEAIAARRKLPAVSAFCRTHYGGILTAAGRWPEAEAALTEAVRIWGLGRRALRGGALIRLADLRARQGRFEEAAQLLEGLEAEVDAARPLGAIYLARRELALARTVLESALEQLQGRRTAMVPLLALLVEVEIAAGRIDAAWAAVKRLDAYALQDQSDYVAAAAALARGQICLASHSADAHACLRQALSRFARAELPVELARSRLALASALADGNPEVALAEARAALAGFERVRAARDADAAAALLRSLGAGRGPGPRGRGPLTKRETEVLDLLGAGLSNPEISDRLFISRKTVEHHVGNVLAKLGLRSRAEAAAYAARRKPGPM